jgi:hypothetical protein
MGRTVHHLRLTCIPQIHLGGMQQRVTRFHYSNTDPSKASNQSTLRPTPWNSYHLTTSKWIRRAISPIFCLRKKAPVVIRLPPSDQTGHPSRRAQNLQSLLGLTSTPSPLHGALLITIDCKSAPSSHPTTMSVRSVLFAPLRPIQSVHLRRRLAGTHRESHVTLRPSR